MFPHGRKHELAFAAKGRLGLKPVQFVPHILRALQCECVGAIIGRNRALASPLSSQAESQTHTLDEPHSGPDSAISELQA